MYERTYHKNVIKEDTAPLKKRRKFPWRKVVWTLCTLLILVGIVYIIRLPALQVRVVVVEGTNVADPEAVSQFVLNDIAGYKFRVFPRSSVFLLSTDTLGKKIKEQFTRFSSVTVKRINTRSLLVTVSEYEGKYVWCQSKEIAECFFMDEKGFVFAPAPYFSGSAYPKVYVGTLQDIPFSPITEQQLSMMKAVIERFPDLGIIPTSFSFNSPQEIIITFSHNGLEPHIILQQNQDVQKAIDVLAAGIRAAQFNSKFRKDSEVLEYIDLRFSNKMVYKFQSQ